MKPRTTLGTAAPMIAFTVAVAFILAVSVSTPRAQTGGERIGQVTFPTSCAASVQKSFERAVALLHSFWYIEAAKAFSAVTQADPDCAIAYWGLAMSQWTQIWAPPQPAALKRGWDAVEKAKAAHAKTPRERDFVAAAEAFFKDADKIDHRARAQAFPLLHSSQLAPKGDNRGFFVSRALDEAIDKATLATTDQARLGALREAQQIAIKEAPYIFLISPNMIVGTSKKVHGVMNLPLELTYLTEKSWKEK